MSLPKEAEDLLEQIFKAMNEVCDAHLNYTDSKVHAGMEVYNMVYNACTCTSVNVTSVMYSRLKKWTEDTSPEGLSSKVAQRLPTDLTNLDEVRKVKTACEKILKQVKLIFSYLATTVIFYVKNVESIEELMVKAFRKALLIRQSLPPDLQSVDHHDETLRLWFWHPSCLKAVRILGEEGMTPVPWDCFRDLIDLYAPEVVELQNYFWF